MNLAVSLVLAAMAVASTSAGDMVHAASGKNCPSACPEVYQPVCGSDGVTYSNKCFLTMADCNSSSGITQASDGECAKTAAPSSTGNSESSKCSKGCTRIYSPVCGSDGVTYSNACVLSVAQCKSGGAITQVSNGQCPSSSSNGSELQSEARRLSTGCPDACLDVYEPVTDENGVEYSNECYLQMAKCENNNGSSNGSSVNASSSAEESERDSANCDNKVCTMDYNPVCGSDGVTYSNFCMLEIANCKDSSITKSSDGACAASE